MEKKTRSDRAVCNQTLLKALDQTHGLEYGVPRSRVLHDAATLAEASGFHVLDCIDTINAIMFSAMAGTPRESK